MKLKTIVLTHKTKSGATVSTPYVTVNARLKHFRESGEYAGYQLVTEILKHDDEATLIKASLISPDGVVLSTGHAYERASQGFINKTSHVENAETSACGRCLGIYGIGIDEEVRSYEEMSTAIEGQKTPKKRVKESVSAAEQSISKNDVEAILMDCTTVDEVTQVWWKMTKEQQADKDIKFYFTARKGQLNG